MAASAALAAAARRAAAASAVAAAASASASASFSASSAAAAASAAASRHHHLLPTTRSLSSNPNNNRSAGSRERDLGAAVLAQVAAGGGEAPRRPGAHDAGHVAGPQGATAGNRSEAELGFNPLCLSRRGEVLAAPALVAEIAREAGATDGPDHMRIARLLLAATDLFALVRAGEGAAAGAGTAAAGEEQKFELLVAQQQPQQRGQAAADESAQGGVLHLFSSQEAAEAHRTQNVGSEEEAAKAGIHIAKMDGVSIFALRGVARVAEAAAAGAAAGAAGGSSAATTAADAPEPAEGAFAQVVIDGVVTISNDGQYLEGLGAAVLAERAAFAVTERDRMNALLKGEMDGDSARLLRSLQRFQPYAIAMQAGDLAVSGGRPEDQDDWHLMSTEDHHGHHYAFAFSHLDHAANFVRNLVDAERDGVRLRMVTGANLLSTVRALEADGFILNPGNPDRTIKLREHLFTEADKFLDQ